MNTLVASMPFALLIVGMITLGLSRASRYIFYFSNLSNLMELYKFYVSIDWIFILTCIGSWDLRISITTLSFSPWIGEIHIQK